MTSPGTDLTEEPFTVHIRQTSRWSWCIWWTIGTMGSRNWTRHTRSGAERLARRLLRDRARKASYAETTLTAKDLESAPGGVCPRCGRLQSRLPAVSLHDYATDVCWSCAMDERIRQTEGREVWPGFPDVAPSWQWIREP